jgi:hypothetical protein
MFKAEADMAKPVKRWMESLGLLVRSEFISPWGICDFVGLSFSKIKVARRLALGQKCPVTSMARAALLLRIPDVESNKCTTLADLIAECAPAIPTEIVTTETRTLIKDKYLVRDGDRLQKVNGWMPLQKRLMAVELKVKRVEQAILQAQNNLGFASESYVGLPAQLANRIAGSNRRNEFLKLGIGLLAVTSGSCRMLILSRPEISGNPVFQFCCVEKFWREATRGN